MAGRELITRQCNWDVVLVSPLFWAAYLRCNAEGLVNAEGVGHEAVDDTEARLVSVPFVASPIELRKYRSFTWERRRGLLDAAGGDVERALQAELQRDPVIERFDLADDVRRELEDAKGPAIARPGKRSPRCCSGFRNVEVQAGEGRRVVRADTPPRW